MFRGQIPHKSRLFVIVILVKTITIKLYTPESISYKVNNIIRNITLCIDLQDFSEYDVIQLKYCAHQLVIFSTNERLDIAPPSQYQHVNLRIMVRANPGGGSDRTHRHKSWPRRTLSKGKRSVFEVFVDYMYLCSTRWEFFTLLNASCRELILNCLERYIELSPELR
jgi:hypothetical protein